MRTAIHASPGPFRARLVGDYSADLFVDNRLIIELKAAKALADEHVAQILGYLRSSRVEHGLLINFGAPKFAIKQYALSRIAEASRPGGLIGGTLSLFVVQYPRIAQFREDFPSLRFLRYLL